jgi:hypothetical protein
VADRLDLLLEAERRGLAIDDEDRGLLAEARRRGLVGGTAAAPTTETPTPEKPGLGALTLEAVKSRASEALAVPARVAGAVRDFVADPSIPNPLDLIPKPAPRIALPIVAGGGPLVQAVAGMGGEVLSQGMEQTAGERTSFDPFQIGAAGAVPLVVSGAVRGVRALGRTATRTIPSVFQKAQGAAQEGAEGIAERLTPEVGAGQLFKAARGSTEAVPAGRITAILDDLDETIPKEPGNAALQQVRTFMGNLRGAVKDGTVDLAELMRQRLDLGREIARGGSAPELRALYGHGGKDAKGIIGALEEAAEAGGAGASAAREALTVFKRDLGVMKWKEMVEQATRRTSISGVETPALNVAKLGNLVEKRAEELTAQLGPEGMALIRGFLSKSRTLPPTHAMTLGRSLIAAMVGTGAGLGAGSIPIGLGAALVPEIATNIFAVGRNPVWVNQLMAVLAQATRTAVMPLVASPERPFNGPRLRVGPAAQEAARGR